tara:strand:+ start:733 stop:1452 length:720 start_codon:yes stop_codon:yes gene_type:complete
VPESVCALTSTIDYGDLDQLEDQLKESNGRTACVFLETIQQGGLLEGYLEGCVGLAQDYGALCVFDETKVGFRVALGGAGDHFGVTPDISTFGKAISNGYAGSFLVGKQEILRSAETRSTWMTATFQSDLLILTAIRTTLSELQRKKGIAYQWRLGDRLITGLNDAFGRVGLSYKLVGCGPMPSPTVDDTDRDRCFKILERCLGLGHYLHPTHPWFLSLAHTEEDIDGTIQAVDEVLRS